MSDKERITALGLRSINSVVEQMQKLNLPMEILDQKRLHKAEFMLPPMTGGDDLEFFSASTAWLDPGIVAGAILRLRHVQRDILIKHAPHVYAKLNFITGLPETEFSLYRDGKDTGINFGIISKENGEVCIDKEDSIKKMPYLAETVKQLHLQIQYRIKEKATPVAVPGFGNYQVY